MATAVVLTKKDLISWCPENIEDIEVGHVGRTLEELSYTDFALLIIGNECIVLKDRHGLDTRRVFNVEEGFKLLYERIKYVDKDYVDPLG